MRRLNPERRLVLALVVSFGLALLAFVVSRAITEIQSRSIQHEAESITENASVAAEALIAARTELRKITSELKTLEVSDLPTVIAEHVSELDVARQQFVLHWKSYLSLPFYPGERDLADPMRQRVASLGQALDAAVERLRSGDRQGALRVIDSRATLELEGVYDGLDELRRFNSRQGRMAANRILASKRPGGLFPDFMGAVFAIVAAYLGIRLVAQYLRWATERSAELEGFAGRVAHDIRSPLGAASMALEIAQRGKNIDTTTRELLARARRTMERIAKLVDGLLVFATSGGYFVPGDPGERKANVAELLGGVVEDMKLEAAMKHIEVDYEPPDPRLELACGPGVLISMTTNLISNAMKFMGDARVRRIAVQVRELPNSAEIAVSDTGPGIAPELRAKVFEPYVRGTSKVPGLGLGLATVRKLARAHGGTVGLDDNPDGGCRVWFRIPRWIDTHEARAKELRLEAPSTTT